MIDELSYRQSALALAPALLGCELVYCGPEGVTAGIIVETEAYHQNDPASHSFRGQTPRNAAMFGVGGRAYVYFTYGMHYCMNVVAGEEGTAEAVLLRALQPTQGIALMQRRRGTANLHNLCCGPAKLTQAMGLGLAHNGASLITPQLHIRPRPTDAAPPVIATTPRIGIRQAVDQRWRFIIIENPFVTQHKFNN